MSIFYAGDWQFTANTVTFSALGQSPKMYEDLIFDLKVSSIHDLGEKFGNLEQTYINGLNKKTSNSN